MTATHLMDALEAELADQVEEKSRAPFRCVDEVRAFVSDENPSVETNITVEMCVVSVKETFKFVRLEMIDYDFADRAEAVISLLDKIDQARRNKFVFSLTLWKPKKRVTTEEWIFEKGQVYCFAKVHALRLFYALPQGSAQLKANDKHKPLCAVETRNISLSELEMAARDSLQGDDRRQEGDADSGSSESYAETTQLNEKDGGDSNPSPKKRGRKNGGCK
ncbi:hypothetical protein PHYBOEH_001244 [Phytophthora boehmeriae]|uniref:Uncharacterized protein n=1 Tax=Phytophthora boehmeriae TaxID=109152 RepID=A0A8T1WZD4_9STRA|nr:hypothetical protein PHYBOEH_001244 [Phytophthora boehmeriae]